MRGPSYGEPIRSEAGPDASPSRPWQGAEFTLLWQFRIESVARALQLSGPLRRRFEANSGRRRSIVEPGLFALLSQTAVLELRG